MFTSGGNYDYFFRSSYFIGWNFGLFICRRRMVYSLSIQLLFSLSNTTTTYWRRNGWYTIRRYFLYSFEYLGYKESNIEVERKMSCILHILFSYIWATLRRALFLWSKYFAIRYILFSISNNMCSNLKSFYLWKTIILWENFYMSKFCNSIF